MSEPKIYSQIHLCGLAVHSLTQTQAVAWIINALRQGQGGWVLTVNLDILRRWAINADFRTSTQAVSLCVADGMPLIWASRVQGQPLPERIAGSDIISNLSAAAAGSYSIYLLGGAPGTAEKAATVLTTRYPALQVAGTVCPGLGFEHSRAAMDALRNDIASKQPDIVFVALGSPKQEVFISKLRVDFPHIWWLGIGASFSFLAGDIARAPVWMQSTGLEWLYRLGQEPGRLARRYLLHDLPFLGRLFAKSLTLRLSQSLRKG